MMGRLSVLLKIYGTVSNGVSFAMQRTREEYHNMIEKLEAYRRRLFRDDMTTAKTWQEFRDDIAKRDVLVGDGLGGYVEIAFLLKDIDEDPMRKRPFKDMAEAEVKPKPKGKKRRNVSEPPHDEIPESVYEEVAKWYKNTSAAQQTETHVEQDGETISLKGIWESVEGCQGKSKPQLIQYLKQNRDVFDNLSLLKLQYESFEGRPLRSKRPFGEK